MNFPFPSTVPNILRSGTFPEYLSEYPHPASKIHSPLRYLAIFYIWPQKVSMIMFGTLTRSSNDLCRLVRFIAPIFCALRILMRLHQLFSLHPLAYSYPSNRIHTFPRSFRGPYSIVTARPYQGLS